jgi:hypothetical protein
MIVDLTFSVGPSSAPTERCVTRLFIESMALLACSRNFIGIDLCKLQPRIIAVFVPRPGAGLTVARFLRSMRALNATGR